MKNLKVGLQMYSVRQALKADFSGTLAKVKAMGYDYVEMAGGRYERTGGQIREELDKAGLSCISVHQSPTFFQNDPRDAVDYIKTLGAKNWVIPMWKKDSFEDWEGTLRLFSQILETCEKEGLKLLYHNHDYEIYSGVLDRLLQELPLSPELDICWVSYGGVDPVQVINQYAERLDIVHLKDYCCDALPQIPVWQLPQRPEKRSVAGFRYRPVGSGVEDWQRILAATENSAARYVVVEQDDSKDRDPLDAAAMSRNYLKGIYGI